MDVENFDQLYFYRSHGSGTMLTCMLARRRELHMPSYRVGRVLAKVVSI